MAIDTNDTKNKLFGGLAKQDPEAVRAKTEKPVIELPCDNPGKQATQPTMMPKYQTFDKVTTLLTTEQKERLDRVAKKIMKRRAMAPKGSDSERVTANTVIRALIDNFLAVEESFQHGVLYSENDVSEWIKEMFKQGS